MREQFPLRRSLRVGALVAALTAGSLAPTCGAFRTIVIDEPLRDFLTDDPSVSVSARIGTNFDPASVAVRLDGVDLVAALGLVPPFQDEGGSVVIGGDVVTVSGFTYDPALSAPPRAQLVVAGLDPGDHEIAVSGVASGGGPVTRLRSFSQVAAFVRGPELLAAGANPAARGPVAAGAEGFVANAALGDPFAAAPVAFGDGSELRPGFVEAVEARVAGGGGP